MSEYGEGWRERGGDVVVPDEANYTFNDDYAYASLDALAVPTDQEDPFVSAAKRALEVEMDLEPELTDFEIAELFGPDFLSERQNILESFEKSKGYADSRKLRKEEKEWVSPGQYISGRLYKLKSDGMLTQSGLDELIAIIGSIFLDDVAERSNSQDMPQDITPEAIIHATPQESEELYADDDIYADKRGVRREYKDPASARPNDY